MREMNVDQKIDHDDVYLHYTNICKLYRGRPEMLLMKMSSNDRNLQMFRGGKVQILGALSNEEAENMRQEFEVRLKKIKQMENCHVSNLTITNLVASLQFPSPVYLRNLSHSNHDMSYEVEIFPAALIRKWHPAHVAIFHNGKMIVTGIKSVDMLETICEKISNYISQNRLTEK